MEIKKFENETFGTLTTIKSPKTGQVMFIAAEVGKMWGHTNMKQVVSRLLSDNEYLVINKSKYPDFFKILVSNKMLPSKAQRVQLITESALYKLALASNLEKAKPFRDWVTSEVLPSIRSNGYYALANQTQAITIHTVHSVQKKNSKDINSKNYIESGINGIIEYNRQSCLLHTGMSTKQVKELGKEKGLKSKECSSAKEVLRNISPEIACGMSFTDDLVKNGFDLKTVSELTNASAIPLFRSMLQLGIKPSELDK